MDYESINLKSLRESKQYGERKEPRVHQLEAFQKMSKVFTLPLKGYKAGLLVLPTGAGKTFTAVNWLCRNILSKNIKVLWLAQSAYLLDQAFESFKENAVNIPPSREYLNLRVVSSKPSHSKSSDIEISDDVLIITAQTVISNFVNLPMDQKGERIQTKFFDFLKNLKEEELFIVVDEAHHVPAYGLRTLLLSIKEMIPDTYLLGLTATPIHGDKKISGWLYKIFEQGILYEADKIKLILNSILAVPEYIEKETGRTYTIDDKKYTQIVREHKDLPEDIVNKLAEDSERNNYIVQEYIDNREKYGKTLIFADRWFQCEFMKEKLNRIPDIEAETVYSNSVFGGRKAGERGNRTLEENHRIIEDFRNSKHKHKVLLNVKMMTEGVDVPDIKTVFITRQTTSPILMTQMIGRALRGKRSGGGETKESANIVLFMDHWERLIHFANPKFGGMDETKPLVKGYYPYEFISMNLLTRLIEDIGNGNPTHSDSNNYYPHGWYEVRYTVSHESDEELQTYIEFVLVYDQYLDQFQSFIENVLAKVDERLADERLPDEKIRIWIEESGGFLKDGYDDHGEEQVNYLIRIVRHIAQNGIQPEYYPFTIREQLDLRKLAETFLDYNTRDKYVMLLNEYEKAGSFWKVFYQDFHMFRYAYQSAEDNLVAETLGLKLGRKVEADPPNLSLKEQPVEINREAVYNRDKNQCVCCGKKRAKGVRLEVDHIMPYSSGGPNTLSNLQTLCKECNIRKSRDIIDFRNINISMISSEPEEMHFIPRRTNEDSWHTLARTINFFYRCSAVSEIHHHIRRTGQYYTHWVIELYDGNNLNWLKKYQKEMIQYIQTELECSHVRKVTIKLR